MLIAHCTAPGLEVLRPLRPTRTPSFPVYGALADHLASVTAHPDATVAHALATCSGYSYSDAATLATIMARLGLDGNHCVQISTTVDAMFIRSTAFVVQSRDGRVVIVSYRGTEPTNIVNWLTDVDINPEKVSIPFPGSDGTFDVHGGFYRNVRATRFEVVATVERALDGKSVRPGGPPMPNACEALYLTGHSLGGALAAMLGVMVVAERDYEPFARRLRAVYTYGQPMVGAPDLAAASDRDPFLGRNVIRYVYGNDVVTRLPPRATGDFSHFGRELRCDRRSATRSWVPSPTPRTQIGNLLELAMAPLAFVTRQVPWLAKLHTGASLHDHLPHHYVSALTPAGVRSEFGD
ncbi:MAG TPA: lipase family protein [Acidimicrobiales bacterium]|nr:lipase family protein [Acidimicrobiales bacterium]